MCQQLAKWTMKSLESVCHLDHVSRAYWKWTFFCLNNINHCVKAPIFHAMKSLLFLQKFSLMASITYLTYEEVDIFTWASFHLFAWDSNNKEITNHCSTWDPRKKLTFIKHATIWDKIKLTQHLENNQNRRWQDNAWHLDATILSIQKVENHDIMCGEG